ncbi:MAG: DUF4870 domain-containing protein [Candidatus Woesearchaeota archaeon]
MVKQKSQEDKGFAFLGIFLTVIGFLLVLLLKKQDKYAMYYAKQGLVLFIGFVLVNIASWFVSWIPIIGNIITAVLWAGMIILWILGLVYSLSGEEKEIPIIGEFADKIKI